MLKVNYKEILPIYKDNIKIINQPGKKCNKKRNKLYKTVYLNLKPHMIN